MAKRREDVTTETEESSGNGVKRLIVTLVLIVIELLLLLAMVKWLTDYASWISLVLRLLASVLVLLIYNKDETSAMKMPWIILIMAFPLAGIVIYNVCGHGIRSHVMEQRYQEVDRELYPLLPAHDEAIDKLSDIDKHAGNIARYLHDHASYPTYNNTDIEYYDDATKGIEAQKEELHRAEKFIFMEYHAIENAESWWAIQEILEERAAAGVDVRVFYDDMGSIGFIDKDFVQLMESKGIRCRVFNPFAPGLNIFLNNRDHRKITVVDGRVGFTGGYNIANMYFNIDSPFGHWKDTGVKLTGEAVKSLTVAFLEMWNAVKGDDENDTDFAQYLPDIPYLAHEDCFVAPYADSPMDNEQVGENVYISVAEYAQDYAWFITPYLILTDEAIHALSLAAKRGVDVRIITPGIPDKKMVYSITRSYYYPLVRNGVRIYEYTPGFCHAKMSVTDDKLATCGTINLDYRSLYHHFENGCLYYGCDAVADTKHDFEGMFVESNEVTEAYKDPRYGMKFVHLLLRLFAPLL